MMADFAIMLPDRPGELAKMSASLKDAGIGLVGLWGYGGVNGKARFYCVPENAERFRDFVMKEGLEFAEGLTIYLSGPDRGGALVETLDRIASAGVNLHAIQAVAVQGDYGCFIWAEPKDWDIIARVLEKQS
jgi:hypothetical protein